MSQTERWVKRVQFFVHEENDGHRALREGLQPREFVTDGSGGLVEPKSLADVLKQQLRSWPSSHWDTLIAELGRRQ